MEQHIANSKFPGKNNTAPYIWYYEMSLFKNMTILKTLIKVCIGVCLFLNLGLQLLFLMADGSLDLDFFIVSCCLYSPILIALILLGYLVYCAIMKGSYCVVFEMDEQGISHTQVARQFKKAQVAGAITAVLGALSGSLSIAGTGILAGSRNSLYTEFSKIDSMKLNKKQDVIYLRSRAFHNQIYVPKQHFDDVVNYIK